MTFDPLSACYLARFQPRLLSLCDGGTETPSPSPQQAERRPDCSAHVGTELRLFLEEWAPSPRTVCQTPDVRARPRTQDAIPSLGMIGLNPHFVCGDHKCCFKTLMETSFWPFLHPRSRQSNFLCFAEAPPRGPCKSARSKSCQADATFVRKSSGSLKRRKVPRLLAALCFWHRKLFPEAHSGPPGASVRQRQRSNGFAEAPFPQTCGFLIRFRAELLSKQAETNRKLASTFSARSHIRAPLLP